MSPVDQTQQGEDAKLCMIVSRLHVNLGHPSNDDLARAIRLSGGSDDAIQAAVKVRCTVCERLTEPSPVRGQWRFLRKDRTSLDKAPYKAVGESSVVMARRLRKQPV